MSAVQQKRGRACEACSKIKIRCELGSTVDAAPPCERCVRLGKDCTLVAPKRQKDRVAELEAEVERLTRLLREKGISSDGDGESPTYPSLTVATNASSKPSDPESGGLSAKNKKRRLDAPFDTVPSSRTDLPPPAVPATIISVQPDTGNAVTEFLDRIISRPTQERLLDRYINQMLPHFPLVLLPDKCSLDSLRQQHPLLLHSVLCAASSGVLPEDSQEEIMVQLLNNLANGAITDGNMTLELVQALQVTCLWFRSPRHHRHVAVYQLVQLAAGIAVDLGLGGPESTSLMRPSNDYQGFECDDAWRAWLTCYMLSSGMAIFSRRPNAMPWTPWHDHAVMMLDYNGCAATTNAWLTRYIRGNQLCEEISELLGFYDTATSTDVADVSMKRRRQNCRNQIADWKSQIPTALHVPTIMVWEHVAIAYMSEPVLHTSTNKRSFAAPYISERLSVTDFPAPIVTPEHTAALFELKSAAHSIIDIFLAWDADMLVTLSAIAFTARAAYALYMLAKMYVAVTAPGNTYGTVMDAGVLQLEQHIRRMLEKSKAINAVDASCGTARILRSAHRANDWYNNYVAALETSSASTAQISADEHDVMNSYALQGLSGENRAFQNQDSLMNLEELFWFSDGAADYGLETLFAEPPGTNAGAFMAPDFSKSMPEFAAPFAAQWLD